MFTVDDDRGAPPAYEEISSHTNTHADRNTDTSTHISNTVADSTPFPRPPPEAAPSYEDIIRHSNVVVPPHGDLQPPTYEEVIEEEEVDTMF